MSTVFYGQERESKFKIQNSRFKSKIQQQKITRLNEQNQVFIGFLILFVTELMKRPGQLYLSGLLVLMVYFES
jgi:hypothetical protein